jgi:propanol-preferring alcohol dehydrogenase
MKAMLFEEAGKPLALRDVPTPAPGPHEILIKVLACGVCRTDLHIVDGDLPAPQFPLILGHQIVGKVEQLGSEATIFRKGDLVGVPWLGGCCFTCPYCESGRENLCDHPQFTGYSKNGGFAEYAVADEAFVLPIPPGYSPESAAPLLCAGLIGYRALSHALDGEVIGFYGFGSSAHLTLQFAKAFAKKVFIFTRPGDAQGQQFARQLGADWAGGSDEKPPEFLDAAIVFAPAGELMIEALKILKKGGKVISAGIHMTDIPSFPYKLLWEERELTSVANLTRQDGWEAMNLASKVRLNVVTTLFPLEKANEALQTIREGKGIGSVVLKISD